MVLPSARMGGGMATKKKKPAKRSELLGRPLTVRNVNEDYWDRLMALALWKKVSRANVLDEAILRALKENKFDGELTEEQQALLDHVRSKKG